MREGDGTSLLLLLMTFSSRGFQMSEHGSCRAVKRCSWENCSQSHFLLVRLSKTESIPQSHFMFYLVVPLMYVYLNLRNRKRPHAVPLSTCRRKASYFHYPFVPSPSPQNKPCCLLPYSSLSQNCPHRTILDQRSHLNALRYLLFSPMRSANNYVCFPRAASTFTSY